jgi:uncharacterized membrane protein YkvA (DUF1232 family)
MAEQPEFMPTGISRKQFAALVEYAFQSETLEPADLERHVKRHLDDARIAHSRNRIVNLRLATAIASVAETLLADWDSIAGQHRNWLGGAILYFADSNDSEHDFSSAIGFEDDAEVMNACLKLAGKASLCIEIEDFDDA